MRVGRCAAPSETKADRSGDGVTEEGIVAIGRRRWRYD